LRKFEDALFLQAQAAGKPILLVFSKSDCPNCTLQAPTLERLLKEDEFKGIEVFQIDFVNQKDLAARFNMNAWSALIGMKGADLRFRSVGLTKPADLRRELRRIL
jgi:thiol-disulfide isomerase/thioredoxin